MNYIKELNAFRKWLLINKLSSGAILLWYTLMSINNMAGWKTKFNANNTIVYQLAGLSKNSLATARTQLQNNNLIVYHKGNKVKAPVYEMISVVDKMNQMINQSEYQFEYQNDDQYDEQYQVQFEGQYESRFDAQSEAEKKNILKQKQNQNSSRGTRAGENPFDVYRENFGILRPVVRDSLIEWCRELGDDIVIEAMKLAIKKGAFTLGYVEEILKEWANAKLESLDQVRDHEEQKSAKRKNSLPFAKPTGGRNKSLIDELRRENALL